MASTIAHPTFETAASPAIPTLTDGPATHDSSPKEKLNSLIETAKAVATGDLETDSHGLVNREPDVKGVVQEHFQGEDDLEIRDVGWNQPTMEIPDPLIGGFSNGQLWSHIRRFNKDVFDVRSMPVAESVGRLDLTEGWEDDHAAQKMSLNLERIYLTVVLGMASVAKHVARFRSWKETRRTAISCLAYFVAWILDLLVPLLLGTSLILIAVPASRAYMFPPAPLALVSLKTGGIQKPQAGVLGTTNTLTGAPEKQEGQAAEEEAENFVNNIRHLLQRAIGMHQQPQRDGDPLEGKLPKPARKLIKAIQDGGAAAGHATEESSAQPTQQPMEEILWSKAKPANIWPVVKTMPHALGEVADTWERFANALSSPPPFSRYTHLRLAAVILPLFLMSLFVPSYMVYKGAWFGLGFVVFGDPLLTPALQWLNRTYPNWPELLDLKNNILRNVPTNRQMTLTLLRIGEANKTPLPPVPRSDDVEAIVTNVIDPDEISLAASRTEIEQAILPSAMPKAHQDEVADQQTVKAKHKHISRFITFMKGSTRVGVEAKIGVDHVRAALGSESAKNHLGVLPKAKVLVYAGPSEFKARFQGKRGWVYITRDPNNPMLAFIARPELPSEITDPTVEPLFVIPATSIHRLKRLVSNLGFITEKAADWSTDKNLLGSVEVSIGDELYSFTSMPERDALYNRLVAIGKHRWENV